MTMKYNTLYLFDDFLCLRAWEKLLNSLSGSSTFFLPALFLDAMTKHFCVNISSPVTLDTSSQDQTFFNEDTGKKILYRLNPWYAQNIFATFLHEMGSRGPTKENAQLNRQNEFSFTQIKLVYWLTRKIPWCNSLVQKICIFLHRETLEKQLGVGSPGTTHYIFGNQFYSKN